jgi:hypothetical protein
VVPYALSVAKESPGEVSHSHGKLEPAHRVACHFWSVHPQGRAPMTGAAETGAAVVASPFAGEDEGMGTLPESPVEDRPVPSPGEPQKPA